MTALVIDDEILSRKRIINLLKENEQVELVGEYSNGKSAVVAINGLKPDMIFLDINMRDMTGFEVLKEIKTSPKPIVIFVTAHQHHALKAFDHDALDFLLKPYKDERFFKTLEKAFRLSKKDIAVNFDRRIEDLFKLYQHPAVENAMQKMAIRQGNKTFLIETEKIKYVLASGYYAEIFSDTRKYLIRESLQNLMNNLNPDIFFRVHRSAIININCVREIVHSNYSEIDLKMEDNKLIRVSKSKKKEFLNRIGI